MSFRPIAEWRVRVSMGDVDADRIHFATYFDYMDRTAAELYHLLGAPPRQILAEGYGLPVVHTSCDYASSLYLDDEVLVQVAVDLGRTSLTERYRFSRMPDYEEMATATTVHVCVDLESGRPMPVPDQIRGAAEDLARRAAPTALVSPGRAGEAPSPS